MIRRLLVFISLIVLSAATAAAAVFPPGTAIAYTRLFPASYIPVGIPATVQVELTNSEGSPLSGLYYSEQFPDWLSVQAGEVRINGEVTAFTYEHGDGVIPGRHSHRWVIDNPLAPGGRNVLGPGDVLTIDYSIRATQVAAFQANTDGWFSLLIEDEETAAHGWDAAAPLLHFVENTDSAPLGASNRLAPAYPNPFNPSTTLRFESEAPGSLRLVIVDAAGRELRELATGDFPAGHHTAVWDGRDDAGRNLPSGLYLAHLSDGEGLVGSQKLMLLK